MIPNIHQSIDEIIKSSTPAQKILWQQVRLFSGENAAIQQLHFSGGMTVPNEFTTPVTGKLYFAYELDFSCETSGGFNTIGYITLAGVSPLIGTKYYANNSAFWNATAAAVWYQANDIILTNVLFSSVTIARYRNMKFTGYKIQS